MGYGRLIVGAIGQAIVAAFVVGGVVAGALVAGAIWLWTHVGVVWPFYWKVQP